MPELATGLILNLGGLMKDTTVVGPGRRDAIYLQGCSIRCPGCANQEYLEPEPRLIVSVDRVIDYLKQRVRSIDGVSFTGGEPTDQLISLTRLVRGVKQIGLSVVLFTGRIYEELQYEARFSELLSHTDLLIDSPYNWQKRDLSLHWRGSTNQRLIRLSDYFQPSDLAPKGPNGEIVIFKKNIVHHGIGSLVLSK